MYAVVGEDGVVYGPVPLSTLLEWIGQGRIVPTTVLIDWQGRRMAASAAPELQGAFPVQSQPYGYAVPGQIYAPSGKRRSTALWLAFVLGFLGAHRFYLGHYRSGLVMLVLNLMVCGMGWEMAILLVVVTTVWLIADMSLIAGGRLVGTDGRPLA